MTAKAKAGRFILAAMAMIWAGAATGVTAADDPAYLVEERAFERAQTAGDAPAAIQHALAAWQSAEAELGNTPVTRRLAFLYGKAAVFQNLEQAKTALLRAQELTRQGDEDPSPEHVSLYLAYVSFAEELGLSPSSDALRAAILAFENSGGVHDGQEANILFSLAEMDIKRRRFVPARTSAAKAAAAIETAYGKENPMRATALIYLGVAHLFFYPMTLERASIAIDALDDAISSFPPQKDLESFDPILGLALAWRAGASAAYAARHDDHESPEMVLEHSIFEHEEQSLEKCGTKWKKKPKPKYPLRIAHKGAMGGAALGYELRDDLKLHNLRVLGGAPDSTFAEASLLAAQKAVLENIPVDTPGCRGPNVMTFYYYIYD